MNVPAALLLILLSFATAAIADDALRDHLTAAQSERLLTRLGHTATSFDLGSGQAVHVLDFDGTKAVLRHLDCADGECRALRLNASYHISAVSLASLNRWNAEPVAEHDYPAKAFLDHNGHVQLVCDLDLEGGVHDADLAAFVNDFANQARELEAAVRP